MVLFGANDILQNIGFPDGGASGPGNILPGVGALAANDVDASIRAINAIDANYNDFIVINFPDLSQTPLFQNQLIGASALAPFAANETVGFNTQMAQNIDVLESEGFNIIEFDLGATFQDYLAVAGQLGVDTDTPCSFNLSNPHPVGTCVFAPGAPGNTDLALANNFSSLTGYIQTGLRMRYSLIRCGPQPRPHPCHCLPALGFCWLE